MQQVVLRRYCVGRPTPEDFAVVARPVPEPDPGQFLVRHIWNSVDPGTRSRLSGESSYAPALGLGKAIDGFSVGRIVQSEAPDWPAGTLVFCAGGWRTHSLQTGQGFIGRIPATDLPLSYWIGVLGVPGLTSWFGLKETGAFRAGDRVLVTSAAGPVGATAGQLARAEGAGNVVGVAGSPDKCAWLTQEAGFDAALDYKTEPDLTAAIQNVMPDGIDLLFDNVGNAMIDRVLPLMRRGGRIVVSGQVADYNLAPETRPGIRNTTPFITQRLRMEGLVVFDFAARFPEALDGLVRLIRAGQIQVREERFEGIETMPEAFCGLFEGENFGRRVVRVGEDE